MNLNSIINMVIRQVVRRGVNLGVNAAFNRAGKMRRDPGAVEDQRRDEWQERPPAKNSGDGGRRH